MSSHQTLSPSTRQQLLETRTRLVQFSLSRHALILVLQAMAVLWVAGAVDFLWPTRWPIRAAVLLGLLALMVRRAWLTHVEQKRTDEFAAAQWVEESHPELGQRLRTAYQYDAGNAVGDAPQLTDALIDDTNRYAARIDFTDKIPWSRLSRDLAVAAVGACAAPGHLNLLRRNAHDVGTTLVASDALHSSGGPQHRPGARGRRCHRDGDRQWPTG